jgi:hypothetical protein
LAFYNYADFGVRFHTHTFTLGGYRKTILGVVMIVTCESCGVEYDDLYCLTFCPHDKFDMHCIVGVGKFSKCCHTVEEVNEFIMAHISLL